MSINATVLKNLLEVRRDYLVPAYIAHCIPDTEVNGVPLNETINTADDLYEYLLMDPQNSAQVDATFIADMISSLQTYINRCLGGNDPEVDEGTGSAMVEESRPGGFLSNWSDYNQAYSTWAGKKRLLHYPSIYITPALRSNKTSLFSALEQTISQGKINTNRITEAYTEYLNKFETLANLTTISAYQSGVNSAYPDNNDSIYFIGKTTSEPSEYYLRRCNLSIKNDANRLTGGAWSEWTMISAPIGDSAIAPPAPFWFNNRYFVCWLSCNTEGSPDDTQSATTYIANLYYLNSDGKWCSFRKIPIPFSMPGRVWCANDVTTKKYILFAEVADVDGSPILYAYLNDNSWTLCGSKWAPQGFIHSDVEFVFANIVPVQAGDTFYVSGTRCVVESVTEDNIKIASILSLVYSSYNVNDVVIQRDVRVSQVDGSCTIPLNEDISYITLKGSDKPDLRLNIKVAELNTGFANTYFRSPYFKFTKDELQHDDGLWVHPLAEISTNSGPFFYEQLAKKGISGLLSYKTQKQPIEYFPPHVSLPNRISPAPINFDSSYGLYFWEIFFYTSFLIADRYLTEQNYENSALWYKYIFNSTGYRDIDGAVEKVEDSEGDLQVRYWNVVPLQEDYCWNTGILDTTDPDAIAMNDPMHFKMAIFLKTVNMLIENGDHCYRQLEPDMLTQARMYYLQASQYLGARPEIDYNNSWPNPTLAEEAVVDISLSPNQDLMHDLCTYMFSQNGHFLPPFNEDLLLYWDKLAVRFYNLRHNLSLNGQPLTLPSYATPLSPTELQRRNSAGNGPGGNITQVQALPSQLRFSVLIDRARSAANNVVQFGAQLLSVLEKRDNETMTLLLQTQQKSVLAQTQNIQQINMAIQQGTLDALEKSLDGAKRRRDHYGALYNNWISTTETQAMNLQAESASHYEASQVFTHAAAVLDSFPNVFGLAFGGIRLGGFASALAADSSVKGLVCQNASTRLTLDAQYRRRREDWLIQRDNAEADVGQITSQITAQTEQIHMAQKQLSLNELERANQEAVYQLQSTRFTGQPLYSWMTSRLSALYYQLYDATLPLCLTAKAALVREIGAEKAQNLFTAPMWNDLYQGLFAGEGLVLELQRLENTYLQHDKRGLEVQRTVSLNTQLAKANPPDSLASVIDAAFTASDSPQPQDSGASGITVTYMHNNEQEEDSILRVTLDISTLELANACNSNDRIGRFYGISVTLPGLLGPYQDLNATLEMQYQNASLNMPGTMIALSRGLDDSGMFTMETYNTSKYLPFEGLPTEAGTLVLSFYQVGPLGQQRALVESLADAIYQLRYTLKDQ
ncbi:neuraminidase-like domain-containing protein [Pseudomonas sp. NPDC098747]|uniref:Tc toxin subunit A-related protein n=1 Tax=Pseudomonas sp. NPDC098747 TaxID=3364487 RepID=UPI003839DD66